MNWTATNEAGDTVLTSDEIYPTFPVSTTERLTFCAAYVLLRADGTTCDGKVGQFYVPNEEVACIDPALIDPNANCDTDYDPVCGCDHETYENACIAENEFGIVDYTPGACFQDNTCFANYFLADNLDGSVTLSNASFGDFTDVLWTATINGVETSSTDDTFVYVPEADNTGEICLTVSNPDPAAQCNATSCFPVDAFFTFDCEGLFGIEYTPTDVPDQVVLTLTNLFGILGPDSATDVVWTDTETGAVLATDVPELTYAVPAGFSGYLPVAVSFTQTYAWGYTCEATATGPYYDGCYNPSLIDYEADCPTLVDPVCGCDNVTYENACIAENHFGVMTYTPGSCADNDCNLYFLVSQVDGSGVFTAGGSAYLYVDDYVWEATYADGTTTSELGVSQVTFDTTGLEYVCLTVDHVDCSASYCEDFESSDPIITDCNFELIPTPIPGTDSVLVTVVSPQYGPAEEDFLHFGTFVWTTQNGLPVASNTLNVTVPYDPATGVVDLCLDYDVQVFDFIICSGSTCAQDVSTDCNANFQLSVNSSTLTLGNISTGSYDSFTWTIAVNDTLIFSNSTLEVVSLPTPVGPTVMCLDITSADGSCADQYCIPITFTGTPTDPICVASFNGEITDAGLLLTSNSTGNFNLQNWYATDLNGNLTQGSGAVFLLPVDSTAGEFYPFASVCLELAGPNCSTLACQDFYLGPQDSLCAYVDCIWPGDTNGDGFANNDDLLNIGLGYGANGNSRAAATIDWTPQYADNWAGNFHDAINHKHADANGNGMVNHEDIAAIHHNYTPAPFDANQITFGGQPELQLVFNADSIFIDDNSPELISVFADLVVGTPDAPAAELQGLAFSMRYDAELAEGNLTDIDYNDGSFFGNPNQVLSLVENLGPSGRTDVAFTHRGNIGANGQGVVARAEFIIISDIIGSRNAEVVPFEVQLGNVTLVNGAGTELAFDLHDEPTTLYFIDQRTTRTRTPDLSDRLHAYPNPATDVLHLHYPTDWQVETLELFNATGQRTEVRTDPRRRLDVSDLPTGVYWLRLRTPQGVATERVVID